jgi:DNA-directed RNA polymerase subunit M/transcription elongation factor TFIIS
MTTLIVDDSTIFRQENAQHISSLLFKDALCESEETKLKLIAQKIESGVYEFAVRQATARKVVQRWDNKFFFGLYAARLRALHSNLSNDSDLRSRLLSGQLDAEQIKDMTHFDFQPHHWENLLEKKRQKEASLYNTNQQPTTSLYKCKKCKSRRCTHFEMQVRSADESTSIFISCIDCGANWREQ